MKVSELISKLKEMPQELDVTVYILGGGENEATEVCVTDAHGIGPKVVEIS